MKKQIDIEYLKDNNLIIFEAIMGSHAYGTALSTSDVDIRGVFIAPIELILAGNYPEQVADDTNDIVYYEIKRFLELLQTNNPNILEILNVPKDCIRFSDPIFDLVLDQKEQFITKQCKMSFAGYAINQIKKARGYNKKINWEESKMVRKNVLDFCYVLEYGQTIPLCLWLEKLKYEEIDCDQRDIGLIKIDHAHDIYAMYFIDRFEGSGIVSDPETANDVQLTSISKEDAIGGPDGHLTFNKDAYSTHCKKYKEYKEWLDNRNEDRFKMNKDHGKNYDSKNMMHCMRLLTMAEEIAEGKIIVRRPDEDRKTLMSIRKGEYDYDKLLEEAEAKIAGLDELYKNSKLPEKVDAEFVDNLLITIRKLRYMNFSLPF